MARETQLLMTALFLAGIAILQVADLVTTIVALQWGAQEGNPFMRWVLETSGTVGLFAIKAFLAAVFIGLAITVEQWQGERASFQGAAVASLLIMLFVVAANSAAIAIAA